MFFKNKVKNGKHVYNIETNLFCMAFTRLLSISSSSITIPTLERLEKQDPAKDIENFLCSIDSNPEVSNSFDRITKISRKETEKGLAYSYQVLSENRKRLLSRLQRKSENEDALIQSRLNVRMVNEKFNHCDDLLKLFLDTHYSITVNLKTLNR